MRMFIYLAVVTTAVFLMLNLVGCGATMATYKDEKPNFAPETWFVGKFKAAGGFFDRFGTLKRRFTMDLVGEREGDLILLHETTNYSDGEVSERTYKIKKIKENQYEATEDHLVGKATIEAAGNALHWKYSLRQKIGEKEWVLNFDDWMFLVDDKTLIDRAEVSKWGINLGHLFLTATKE